MLYFQARKRGPLRKDSRPFLIGDLPRESPSKLVDGVVHSLEVAISVGLLTEDEALPSEAELAGTLKVSTVTLRHALTILRERGLIQTRRGRGGGSYVQNANQFSEARVREKLRSMSSVELRELGDTTATLLGGAARLAALRALPEDVVELEKFALAFDHAEGRSACRRTDSRFHIQIAMAAQSTQLTTLIIQVMGQIAPLHWGANATDPAQEAREHELLVDAIRTGNAARAQELAIAHCEQGTARLVDKHFTLLEPMKKGERT